MKKAPLIILLFITFSTLYSQKKLEYKFGTLASTDLLFERQQIDSTANAVVLMNLGTSVFINKEDKDAQTKQRIVSTSYYKKIKFFNKEAIEKHSKIVIPLYNSDIHEEDVINIKAVTHNNGKKSYLETANIFEERVDDNHRVLKFTMPNVNAGSIIEIEYTIETPFTFRLTGWVFQTDIPVVYSRYNASLPGNYVFNRQLLGNLKLSENNSTVKINCFEFSGFERAASCEVVTYAMKNIPAFYEEEFMIDKSNFISKIKFSLAEYQRFNGTKIKYTSTWKDVDKNFKSNKSIGGQLKKSHLFEDLIPSKIKNIPDEFEKAKAIYTFIQNYYSWNDIYGLHSDNNISKSLEVKTANATEINISLLNALKVVNLNAELMLLSTRKNGIPTKVHPIIYDFNSIATKLTINENTYLLDPSKKSIPFGMLPFEYLNGFGRVLDFKSGSYWHDIFPENNSRSQLYCFLKMNNEGAITGKIRKVYTGYEAIKFRESSFGLTKDDLISLFENKFISLEVTGYQIDNRDDITKPLVETFDIKIENIDDSNMLFLNPFFDERISKNPFKQEERKYPIDFGYQRKSNVNFTLELPNNYTIESYPESKNIVLPNDSGSFKFQVNKLGTNKITLNSSLTLKKTMYLNSEYFYLKELYKQTIISQKKPIVIRKNKTQ